MKKSFKQFIYEKATRAEIDEELFEQLKESYEEEMAVIRNRIRELKPSKEKFPDNLNIILFGPAGSGKSSFIR